MTPWLTRAAALAATLAYLGIAVLGRGGFAAFFSEPALTAVALACLVMAGAAIASPGNLSAGEREDRGNRWVIAALGCLGLLSAYVPAWTDRIEFWTLTATPSAGPASRCSWPAARCGSGRCSCSAADSAGWWPFSRDMPW